MPLQSSGQISLSQIAAEFGGSAPHSLSEYYDRGSSPASGAIASSDFYGQGALSFTHLGSITDLDDMIFSGDVNAASLTSSDVLVLVSTYEGYSGTAAYTVNGYNATARVTVTPVQANNQFAGLYIGTRPVTGTIAGDSSLTIAQTTNPGANNSFRAGVAAFRLVNAGIHYVIKNTASNTNNTTGQGGTVSTTLTASSEQIIFVAGHASQGGGSTNTISTSSGSITRYEGVSETAGSGEYAVITGATNPTLTLTSATTATGQGLAIAAVGIGY